MKLPEIITASYNPIDNKIYGCKEGGLVWLHERGHQVYQENGFNSKCGSYIDMLQIIILAFVITKNNILAAFVFLIMLFVMQLPEGVAWIYAIKNFKKIKNENR